MLTALEAAKEIAVKDEFVRLPSHSVVLGDEESKARETIVAEFKKAGLSVPGVKDVLAPLPVDATRARRILEALVRERILVKVSNDLLLHHAAIDNLKQLLVEERSRTPRINVSRFKELAGVSRKYAIPLLEFLDRQRITRREGNERVLL